MTKEADAAAGQVTLSEIGARVQVAQIEHAAEGEERRQRKREILEELEAAEPTAEPEPPSADWEGWPI